MMHGKSRVLIVDDTPDNIQVLLEVFKEEYLISAAVNGERALRLARAEPHPDIILLDIMMPDMDGYEVCRRLKSDPATSTIPILFVTALAEDSEEARGLELGAADYITKPFNPYLVKARVENHLELKRYRDDLEELVRIRTDEVQLIRDTAIESLASLVEYRDPETGGHIKRTQGVVRLLAEGLAQRPEYRNILSPRYIDLVQKCAPLHDIGKVGVPDAILLKNGRLTPEEFEEIKKHTVYGRDALHAAEKKMGKNSFFGTAREIAYSHHEKWDGSGYPQGLRGENIPVSGRLMAVADVYDALISKRVYKDPIPHPEAVEIISSQRGRHFDPLILDVFLESSELIRAHSLEHADVDEERHALASG